MNLQHYLEESPPHLALLEFLFKDQPPSIIFDIGCCEGEDSLRYLRLFPDVRVIAFEPYPPNILRAKALLGDEYDCRFTLIEAAVSDRHGVENLNISSGHPPGLPPSSEWDYGNKSSSLLTPTRLMTNIVPWLKFENTLQVSTLTLDGFAKHNCISAVDFIHIDVQGAELKAFAGAQSLLPRTGVIWAEVADRAIYKDQPTSEQVTAFLREAGFSLVLRSVVDGFGDNLYVNPSYFHVSKESLP